MKNRSNCVYPLPVQLLPIDHKPVHLRNRNCDEIPKTPPWTVTWSYWYPHWSSKCRLWKAERDRLGETSKSIRKRVQAVRDIQNERFSNGEAKDIVCNADMRVCKVRQFCQLQDEDKSLMRSAITQLNLSACAYHRILKLSRTIADLAGCEEIQSVYFTWRRHYNIGRRLWYG